MSESSTESLSQPTQLQEENNAYRKRYGISCRY